MVTCNLCLGPAQSAPVQSSCLRCTVPMIACSGCCARYSKDYGVKWEGLVRSLLEYRHATGAHPTLLEARS